MILAGILPPLGWGINSSLIGHSSKKIGSLATGLGVQTLGLVFTLALFLVFPNFNLPHSTWLQLLFNGVMGGMLFWSLCHIFSIAPASVVTPIIASWTIIAALLGIIFFGEPISALKLLAIPVVALGIIFLTLDLETLRRRKVKIITPGTGLAVLLAFAFGLNAFISTYVIKEIGWLSASADIRIITVLVMVAILASQGKTKSLGGASLKSRLVWVIAALDVLAFSSFNLALISTSLSLVSILAALGPLVTAATSVVFFKERLTLVQAFGAIIAVSGVVLFQV